MKELEEMNCSGSILIESRRVRIIRRKKDRARPLEKRGQLGVSVASDIFAKGRKGGIQPVLPDAGKTDHITEVEDVVQEEKEKGRMIAMLNRKRWAGTLECRHSVEEKWTSLRLSDDKARMQCQKCGWAYSTTHVSDIEE
jgi:hypothetical protein